MRLKNGGGNHQCRQSLIERQVNSTGWIEFEVRGVRHRRRGSVDIDYQLQRVFDVVDARSPVHRERFDELIDQTNSGALMALRPARRIAYKDFRYVLA